MMRRLTAVVVGAGVLLTASVAGAQAHGGIGERGQLIFSADRLFPLFSFTHTSTDVPGPLGNGVSKAFTTNDQTGISLLWGSATPLTFFTVPRLGFDYVIVPNVTVGGDLVIFFTVGGHNNNETDLNNGVTMSNKTDNPSTFIFGVAPRGGYILRLTDLFAVWLRGGFSYYVLNSKTTNPPGNTTTATIVSQNQFALDLDPQFVLTPVPHFGLTLGLTADIPITGGRSTENDMSNGSNITASAGASIFFFGVTAGLLGYF
jgi:hypothetical protein